MKITGKVLILVSLLMLGIGIFFGLSSYSFMNNAVKTEGRVAGIEKSKKRITPTFEYTAGKKKYTLEGAATHPDEYKIGDTEIIYYDPDNPEDAKVGTFMNLWFLPVFLTGFAFITLLAGIVTTFVSKNKHPAFTVKRPGK